MACRHIFVLAIIVIGAEAVRRSGSINRPANQFFLNPGVVISSVDATVKTSSLVKPTAMRSSATEPRVVLFWGIERKMATPAAV